MSIIFIILFILMSGSLYCIVRFNKRFEEIIPITIFGIIMILYVFGLFGCLRLGVNLIIIITLILYILVFYEIYKQRNFKCFLSNLFTPAFAIWVFTLLFLFILHKNRLLINWDEFSHWGDVVKVMYNIDDFSTSSKSLSLFQDYPPGLSLFQYFFQVLNGEFKESLLYITYQIIPISLYLSFLRTTSWKNPCKIIISIIIVLLVPLAFNSGYLKSIYVDALLGMLAGYIFAIIYTDKKNMFFWVKLSLSLAVLILLKDAAKLFAIAALVMVFILCAKKITWVKKINKNTLKEYFKSFMPFIILSLVVILVIISWNMKVKMNGITPVFNGKVDLIQLVKIILNRGDPQKFTIYLNFINALFDNTVFSFAGIEFTYFGTIGLFLLLYFSYFICCRKGKDNFKRMSAIIFCFSLIYTLGIGVMYIFKFSIYEATNLASFGRYINIYFTAMISYFACLILNQQNIKIDSILLVSLLLVSTPLGSFIDAYYNKATNNSIRDSYTSLSEKLSIKLKDDKKKIYIISQQSDGYDYWILKFSIRNNLSGINEPFSWSVGTPYYEGDIWTKDISIEDWMLELKENYDLVLLHKSDEIFIEKFGDAFSSIDIIHSNGIYTVDKKTGKLSLYIE